MDDVIAYSVKRLALHPTIPPYTGSSMGSSQMLAMYLVHIDIDTSMDIFCVFLKCLLKDECNKYHGYIYVFKLSIMMNVSQKCKQFHDITQFHNMM